jgi:hypothetical protein
MLSVTQSGSNYDNEPVSFLNTLLEVCPIRTVEVCPIRTVDGFTGDEGNNCRTHLTIFHGLLFTHFSNHKITKSSEPICSALHCHIIEAGAVIWNP